MKTKALSSQEPTEQPTSPFAHLERLRVSQDFEAGLQVQERIVTVPTRKPNRQEFFFCHPAFLLDTYVLELKDRNEFYILDRALWAQWGHECTRRKLVPFTTRRGGLFIWPLREVGSDGRTDRWLQSGLDAYEISKGAWVRLQADMVLGSYRVLVAQSAGDAPTWPDLTFEQMLEIAFRDHFISDPSHPVLVELKGGL